MIPARSRVCFENVTPLELAAAMRGYSVLPTTMPSAMARVSALIPFACSQPTLPSSMATIVIVPTNAIPGSQLTALSQRLGGCPETVSIPALVTVCGIMRSFPTGGPRHHNYGRGRSTRKTDCSAIIDRLNSLISLHHATDLAPTANPSGDFDPRQHQRRRRQRLAVAIGNQRGLERTRTRTGGTLVRPGG